MLPKKVLWQCFRRSWSVGAAMSARHMQRAGFLYALDPALQALHTQDEALCAARKRYIHHVRTHTLMAPLLVGIFLALEERIAQEKMSAEGMEGLLHTTATTLSAIGDSFFSGSVLVFWALGCFLCFLYGIPSAFVAHAPLWNSPLVMQNTMVTAALAWTGCLLAMVIFFRMYMFYMGVKHNFGALHILRTFDLINWAERIKLGNAFLLAAIFWNMVDGETIFYWGNEVWAVFCVLVAALLIQRAHVPRLVLVILLFAALFLESIKPVVSQ